MAKVKVERLVVQACFMFSPLLSRLPELTVLCYSSRAGAGSLLLEFITLSRLTNSPIFEQVARRAFFAVWNSRSPINLIGNTLDVRTGQWIHPVSGIGAGIDSFFEYAAKAYVLTGEEEYLRVWKESYEAVRKYVRGQDGFWVSSISL